MWRAWIISSMLVAVALPAATAEARDYQLDERSALALAAERAPAVLAARGRIVEAKGRRAGAAVWFSSDPQLSASTGHGVLAEDIAPELSFTLGQSFELGGQRAARIDASDAEVAYAEADADDVLLDVLRGTALAYYRVLFAEERVRLASSFEAMTVALLDDTERRRGRGDADDLEVNLARLEVGRARASVRSAEAEQEEAMGDLRGYLALDQDDRVFVAGSLRVRVAYRLDELLAAARRRPELRALDAEHDEGEALVSLGAAERWPDVRFSITYAHDRYADMIYGSLTFSLPFWNHGQEDHQVGRAQIRRADTVKQARTRTIEGLVRAAFEVYQRRLDAIDEFERNVLPLVDESEAQLADRHAAGHLGLGEYLLSRRDLLDVRADYIDRLHDLANAAIDLESAAGVIGRR